MRYYDTRTLHDDRLGFPWVAAAMVLTSAAGAVSARKARKKAEAQKARDIATEQRRVIAEAERLTVEATLPAQWLNPVVIVGGVLVVGTVLYFATRRRRGRR